MLDDPAKLRALYAEHGDAQIAQMLNCSKATVRNARRRHGIESRPTGRPRGTAPRPVAALPEHVDPGVNEIACEIASRVVEEARKGADAVGPGLIAGRVQAVAAAQAEGGSAALEDALLDLSPAAMMWARHGRRLRK